MTEDVNYIQMKDLNQQSKEHWKGKTIFQLKLPVPSMTSRLAKTKPEPPKTELRLDTVGRTKKANDLKRSRGVPSPDTVDGSRMVSKLEQLRRWDHPERSHCSRTVPST